MVYETVLGWLFIICILYVSDLHAQSCPGSYELCATMNNCYLPGTDGCCVDSFGYSIICYGQPECCGVYTCPNPSTNLDLCCTDPTPGTLTPKFLCYNYEKCCGSGCINQAAKCCTDPATGLYAACAQTSSCCGASCCSSSPTTQPVGACCAAVDVCSVMQASDCSASGGSYMGDNSQCNVCPTSSLTVLPFSTPPLTGLPLPGCGTGPPCPLGDTCVVTFLGNGQSESHCASTDTGTPAPPPPLSSSAHLLVLPVVFVFVMLFVVRCH